jgi:hypothetical protein
MTPTRPNISKEEAALCLAPSRKPAGERHGINEDEDPAFNPPPRLVLAGGSYPLAGIKRCRIPNSTRTRYPTAQERYERSIEQAADERAEAAEEAE